MKVIKVKEVHKLGDILRENLGEDCNTFVLFYGTENAAGESWCPDCTFSNPIIKQKLEAISKAVILIECPVDRAEWKDMNNLHAFRKHPYNISNIPTLVLFNSLSGQEVSRLIESQCNDDEKWLDLLKLLD